MKDGINFYGIDDDARPSLFAPLTDEQRRRVDEVTTYERLHGRVLKTRQRQARSAPLPLTDAQRASVDEVTRGERVGSQVTRLRGRRTRGFHLFG